MAGDLVSPYAIREDMHEHLLGPSTGGPTPQQKLISRGR
jgi:hypothetical protein